MPLLACVLGPIEGHATAEELGLAEAWWAEALPAWRRWVAELREAGVPAQRARLLASSKGNPTPLIPRSRGQGTAPHFRGREQGDALEMAPAVAVEVYACVTCLYSAAALDAAAAASEDVASGACGGADSESQRG